VALLVELVVEHRSNIVDKDSSFVVVVVVENQQQLDIVEEQQIEDERMVVVELVVVVEELENRIHSSSLGIVVFFVGILLVV